MVYSIWLKLNARNNGYVKYETSDVCDTVRTRRNTQAGWADCGASSPIPCVSTAEGGIQLYDGVTEGLL